MAVQKKTNVAIKKIAAKGKLKPTAKAVIPKVPLVPVLPKTRTLYMHYTAFSPYGIIEPSGYKDFYQEGRSANNGILVAPILLPVGSLIKQVVIYYKNNTTEDIMVLMLKHHVAHIAFSGEIEVALASCPPGTSLPDNFLSHTINFTATTGKILDKYMYHIELDSIIKNNTEERVLLGMKIVYREPA